jgi:hypothetical protein
MAKIRIDGNWYDWYENTISQQQIRDFLKQQGINSDGRRYGFTSKNTRSPELVPEDEVQVDPNAVLQVFSFPQNTTYGADLSSLKRPEDFKKLDRRKKFILSQVYQISQRYYAKNSNAVSLHRNGDFVVIRDFPLPFKGDWVGRSTTICLYFPLNYPESPPVGFFINRNLQHRGKGRNALYGSGIYDEPDAFFEKYDLGKKGYGFLCWHPEESWRPDLDNPLKPDNLDSLL